MSKLDIVIAPGPWDPELWRNAFQRKSNGRNIRIWPTDSDHLGPDPYVICAWKADPKIFEQPQAPVAVFSLGAGVDHLRAMEKYPEIPVSRIRDPDLTMRMVEYVTFSVLYLHRQIAHYQSKQARGVWAPMPQAAASDVRVGIMGVGVLGKACAEALQALGFKVSGWARSRHHDSTFSVFAGSEGFHTFLQSTDILISLLPNTSATQGLINKHVFQTLSRDGVLGKPCFINAGRGEAVCQNDLIQALGDGTLGGAVLDVFDLEPLPKENPLWSIPNVLVTPHVAADSDPEVVVDQILKDVQRLEAGQPLEARVDLSKGY